MAYAIPVVILSLDLGECAVALGLPEDYFYEPNEPGYYYYDQVTELGKILGTRVDFFATENYDTFYIGFELDSSFYIHLDGSQEEKTVKLKEKHSHPIIQNGKLAVVLRSM